MSQDYELIEEVFTDGEIPIRHFRNKITGLNVFCADVESPIVKGDFCFATEAHDDDGLPHTLEHLVFMGCEKYPYKGVLDILANRCLASGTNAYTDTDHTSYTMRTAGSEGFLRLLPIYLEHLLFPTLTDEAYATEVHHINGKGDNAGVVYCEMQARENTGAELCYLEMNRVLYPGHCGYSANTGGVLEKLRTSTSNEKCREYHKQFYHTKNLALIVVGPITHEEIFEAIKPIEDKVVEREIHKMDFVRPWSTPVEPLDNSYDRQIEYPSDTDDDGLVYIGFRGPKVANNYHDLVAISILLEYLNSTSISPIQRDFVECSDPYCSSVSHNIVENSASIFYITFESVTKKRLNYVASRLHEVLYNLVRKKEKFNMERMKTILSRKIVGILSTAETSPHSLVVGPVIGHFLYGTGELRKRCQEIPYLKQFATNDADFWLELIDRYMIGVESRHVCIVGQPSPEVMKFMAKNEKERLAKQMEDLKDDLPKLEEKLRAAIEANEKPAPASVFTSVKVPSPDTIKFHQIERVSLDPYKELTPIRFNYDSIKTNFVSIYMLMNTSYGLSKEDRLYLPLLSEIWMESGIMRRGLLTSYQDVVAELYSDTVSYGCSIGLSSGSIYSVGPIGMLFGIAMQVEIGKYEKAAKWFHELVYKTVFTEERMKTIATRLVSDISQYKRSGGKATSATMNALIYQSNSNQWACNFMQQQKFLKNLLLNPTDSLKELKRVKRVITARNNLYVHVTLDKEKIDVSKIHLPWTEFIPERVLVDSPINQLFFESIKPCHRVVSFALGSKGAILGIGSVESGYMQQVVKSINSVTHPDLPAIHVLITYLTQLEGPLWRQIRGLGLSYHYSLDLSPSEGLLRFLLYKSSQLVSAYKKSQELIKGYLNSELEYEDSLFESAKSSLIFQLVKREASAADKSMQSLVAHIRRLDINFNRDLISKVAQVTKDDLKRVGPKYLMPLFEDSKRRTVVCCHPSKMIQVACGFREAGCELGKITLDELTELNENQGYSSSDSECVSLSDYDQLSDSSDSSNQQGGVHWSVYV